MFVDVTVTGLVFTGNVALVDPAGIVTLVGTVANAMLLLDSDTFAPPAGAGPPSVTVPVVELPPGTAAGVSAIDNKPPGGTTVTNALF